MKKILICITFFIAVSFKTPGQCSDAGVCGVGGFIDDERKINLQLSYINGYSGKDDDVTFHTLEFKSGFLLFPQTALNIILPYNIQSGPLGEVNGLGDLIFSFSHSFVFTEFSSLNLSAGTKLSTGDENTKPELPQVYQPGLGTTDFILTIDYLYDNFSAGLGYQLAGGRNEKEGLKLKRGDDLIARVSYSFEFSQLSIMPQILFIKRLSESSIIDTASASERFINVSESDQPQMNFILQLNYPVQKNLLISLEGAVPFLQRDVNIDGLKRAYTVSTGIILSF